MTIRELSKGLGVAVATAHKFSTGGCPMDSIENAKAWVKSRAASRTPKPSATTLTEKRGRKLDLECQLLAIKVEREASNAEFLPVPEVLEAVTTFMRFAHIALRARCDVFAESITACTSPNETIRHLRTLTDEGWATGAVGMAAQTKSTRMGRAIADLIFERFPMATDGHLQSWAKSLGFDLAELTKKPE